MIMYLSDLHRGNVLFSEEGGKINANLVDWGDLNWIYEGERGKTPSKKDIKKQVGARTINPFEFSPNTLSTATIRPKGLRISYRILPANSATMLTVKNWNIRKQCNLQVGLSTSHRSPYMAYSSLIPTLSFISPKKTLQKIICSRVSDLLPALSASKIYILLFVQRRAT